MNNDIKIMPEFMTELDKIVREYKEACRRGDMGQINQTIDYSLRNLFGRQIAYMGLLLHSPEMILDRPLRQGEINQVELEKKHQLLISRVLEDDNWRLFSHKLKSMADLPAQLTD